MNGRVLCKGCINRLFMPILVACLLLPVFASGASTVNAATTVNVSQVKRVNIPQVVQALGSLSAVNQTSVSSDRSGRIIHVLYESGQRVAKGLPVIQLDARQAKSAYQQTVTDYRLAEVKYSNAKKLEDEAVSTQEVQQLKATMDNKFAIMQSSQVALNQLTITAPIAGMLGIFQVSTGDFIKAGIPLVQITDMKHLQVQYQIPESYLPKLKLGQLVTITSNVYPGKVFYGTVSYISPTIDQATRSEIIQASVNNNKELLRPGVFVVIEQKLGVLENALVIPELAVQADVQGYYVYRVVQGRAVKTYITEAERYQTQIVVATGLKEGEVLVTQGQQKLQDGMKVTVLNTPAAVTASGKSGAASQ